MKSDTQFSIGRILGSEEGERDAIHIAVFPVQCAEDYLGPGQRVKLLFGHADQVIRCVNDEDPGIGVVDPFLRSTARKGKRIWVFLNPNTVTGMRHAWTHPALDNPGSPHPSEVWLRQFSDRWGMDYEEMLREACRDQNENDEWSESVIVAMGRDLHGAEDLHGEDVEFWQHLSLLTGRTFSQAHMEGIVWSCNC